MGTTNLMYGCILVTVCRVPKVGVMSVTYGGLSCTPVEDPGGFVGHSETTPPHTHTRANTYLIKE